MPPAKKKRTGTTSTKRRTARTRHVLLFGGGKVHDYRSICPVLKRYLSTITQFKVDYIEENYDVFTAARIAEYDLVVIYHTGGSLSVDQKRGLVEWVASGKGLVGVHGAADSFKSSPEYIAMIGGVFRAHPFVRPYMVSVDKNHPVTRDLKGYTAKHWEKWPVYEYAVTDEQYLLDYDPRVHVLASTVFRGVLWPVAWVKPWGQGKVFYLALGHDLMAAKHPLIKQLLIGGARWASDGKLCKAETTNRFAIS